MADEASGADEGSGGRSYYATPYDLRFRPWSLDFTPDDSGSPAFPHEQVVNPYQTDAFLEWTTGDWDPALRFWTLPFDQDLGQWLKDVDATRPSIMAACELASQHPKWMFGRADLLAKGWLEKNDVAWQPDPAKRSAPDWSAVKDAAWVQVRAEIEQLQQLMQDDRDGYLAEIEEQADGLTDYMTSFIGASEERHPATMELVNCGLAIGNVVYMRYKSVFKRVRPSVLCPGLIPQFGPPAHPAFPSGHSFLGHFIALLLLEIPALRQRFGLFPTGAVTSEIGIAIDPNPAVSGLAGTGEIKSSLLWLAQRLAKGRERLGVHYASDSSASRHLAAGVWRALLHEVAPNKIDCPSLASVLAQAKVEWPTPWA